MNFMIYKLHMFKSNRKRQLRTFDFDKQLDKKLFHLQEEHQSGNKVNHHNQQLFTMLDQVVHELEQEGIEIPQKTRVVHQPVKEVDELELYDESTIMKHSRRKEEHLLSLSQRKVQDGQMPYLWEMVNNPDIRDFIKAQCPRKREGEEIKLSLFVQAAVPYFLGMEASPQQLKAIKNEIRGDVTTTDPELLSLNALQILAKKVSIGEWLVEHLVQVRVNRRLRDVEQAKKRMELQIDQEIDKIRIKEQQINEAMTEIMKKEQNICQRQKTVLAKQKELLLRQKQVKRSIEDKAKAVLQAHTADISQKIKEGEKKLSTIERNIKYKIEILQRRAESIQQLLKQKDEAVHRKVASDNDIKIKLRRLEREMTSIEIKHTGEIEQHENSSKEMLKTLAMFEDKESKNQRKIKKQKQRIKELEAEIIEYKLNCEALQRQKLELQQALLKHQNEVQSNTVTFRERSSSRGGRSKRKNVESDSCMQVWQGVIEYLLLGGGQTVLERVMKVIVQSLPSITLMLSKNKQSKEPSVVSLSIVQMVTGQYYRSKHHQRQHMLQYSSNQSHNQNPPKISANSFAEVLKGKNSHPQNISILLVLLEFVDWQQQQASSYFCASLGQITASVQSQSPYHSKGSLTEFISQYFTSDTFLFYLSDNFVSPLTIFLRQEKPHEEKLSAQLRMSLSVIDHILACLLYQKQLPIDSLSKVGFDVSLLVTFVDCLTCLTSVFSSGKVKVGQPLFKSLQLLEQLCEKLSILLQRIYHNHQNLSHPYTQQKRLTALVASLKQLNSCNGQRYGLIVGNASSLLSTWQAG